MKKILSNILCAIVATIMAFSFSGCHYLDVDAELGITEEEVFSTYSNAYSFLTLAYDANSGKNKINKCGYRNAMLTIIRQIRTIDIN